MPGVTCCLLAAYWLKRSVKMGKIAKRSVKMGKIAKRSVKIVNGLDRTSLKFTLAAYLLLTCCLLAAYLPLTCRLLAAYLLAAYLPLTCRRLVLPMQGL